MNEASRAILQVSDLTRVFQVRRSSGFLGSRGILRAVDQVSFEIAEGETLALVGESGCGKSTSARLILRLINPTSGTVRFDGTDITSLSHKALRQFRRNLQIVFQDPASALDPRMRVGKAVTEPLAIHRVGDRASRRQRAVELLSEVGLSPHHIRRFPHEFSGGQRQRIAIARALALKPRLLVLDEPVSALDVSVQAQIINLLQDLQDEHRLAYLFVAHDLGVVEHIADRVAVMYLGQIVEIGSRDAVFDRPSHPYTKLLLDAVPQIRKSGGAKTGHAPARGEIPSPLNPPSGCRFRTRCPIADKGCATEEPSLVALGEGHAARCLKL